MVTQLALGSSDEVRCAIARVLWVLDLNWISYEGTKKSRLLVSEQSKIAQLAFPAADRITYLRPFSTCFKDD